ncbi:DUF4175 domain-containing protein [Luteimonas sp. S4-F44]|uniref:DUF4175 domain-containing protein n=1 Tax=Luteimonas sp. S4-F44 TaxID=2925842 RepID=UPI001F5361DE|nr:DUF4175 domain-containing protein [Luteimonas sp. S4-F44]UNK41562.1 DUF4175 domain-containing protein [Luteimonas sp. S4-F44]
MSVVSALLRVRAATRRRTALGIVLVAVPVAIGLAALAWRMAGGAAAVVAALLGVALAAVIATRRIRRAGLRWLVRRLDADRRDMEDSAALLFAEPAALAPLAQLQRARLEGRLAARPWTPAPAPWPWRALLLAWSVGVALTVATLAWPTAAPPRAIDRVPTRTGSPGAPVLRAQTLRIESPAYTGLAPRTQAELDAQATIGATLHWTLRFSPQPQRVALQLHDGRALAFVRQGEDWTATLRLEQSWLYRIAVDGDTDGVIARAQPWRLEALPDRPPEVRVRAPETTLSTYTRGQRAWALAFEATDDFGVAADARLRITVTRGSGEAVTFEDHTRTLHGTGDARARTFVATLDPAALGLEEGGDLVAQLEVRDTRVPTPQQARSASLILRWPPPTPPDADGLEGLARDVLPAYFRSQRQIILDAEALIAEQPRLTRETFETRSDTLGVDQRLLRLRYGQFLGEESEGHARPPPTADADDTPPPPPRKPLPIDDFGQDDPSAAAPATQAAPAHDDAHDDHDHDHDHRPADGTTFGRADDVLEAFGHTHDLPEAATLLDPKTRELLRSALREMWQSELHLRQAAPREALAPANRALVLIKEVQQADRIYLARVGTALPPVDFARRLGGDRDGIAPRAVPGPAAVELDAPMAAWQALAWDEAFDPAALVAWAQTQPRALDDPLALLAAIDALQRDPACTACRQALRAQLWQVLQRPLPAPPRRAAIDAMGARYLDALQEGAR